MKKKYILWLNIVFMTLSICFIVVGIYSIKSKEASTYGKFAFVAHDIQLEITGTIVGHAEGGVANGAPTTTPEALTVTPFVDGYATMDLGKRFFSNCPPSGAEAGDINVALTIKNNSTFTVVATVEESTSPTGIAVSSNKSSFNIAQSGSETVIFTLSVEQIDGEYQTIWLGVDKLTINMSFANYIASN